VYAPGELKSLLSDSIVSGSLASLAASKVLDLLESESHLSRFSLSSERYGMISRYAWRAPSPFETALSLRGGSYLSHGTAAFLQGLLDDVPTTFYSNKEQSPKPSPAGLTQQALDRAFANQPRQSALVYLDEEGRRFVGLSGKHSGRLEVVDVAGPRGERLAATSPERTLVDLVVRPSYGGGVPKVLAAFRAGRERVEVALLVATLKSLGHLYPYHQAVGFYMERAGYPDRAIEALRKLPRDFDFYLVHGMKDRDFDRGWRIYFPRGL
jgi:hypothetical protein